LAALAVASAVLVLAGCSPSEQPSESSAPESSGLPTTAQGTTTALPATSAPSDQSDLSSWVGNYSFAEVIPDVGTPPGTVVSYGVSIYQMGTDYFAAVIITGFGTQAMMASVKGDSTTVSLVFSAYLGDNTWTDPPAYKSGDKLLELTKDGDTVTTTWDQMQPQSNDNTAAGTYFAVSTATPTPTPSATG